MEDGVDRRVGHEQGPDPPSPAWGDSDPAQQTGEVGAQPRGDRVPAEDSPEWLACISDDGDTYYTNVLTGETSWDVPTVQGDDGVLGGEAEVRAYPLVKDANAAEPGDLGALDATAPAGSVVDSDIAEEQTDEGEVYAAVWETLERLEQDVEDLLALEDPTMEQDTCNTSEEPVSANTTSYDKSGQPTSTTGRAGTDQPPYADGNVAPGLAPGSSEGTSGDDQVEKVEKLCATVGLEDNGAIGRIGSGTERQEHKEAMTDVPTDANGAGEDQQLSGEALETKEEAVSLSIDSLDNAAESDNVEAARGDIHPVEGIEESPGSLHAIGYSPNSEVDRPGTTESIEALTSIGAPDFDLHQHSPPSDCGDHAGDTIAAPAATFTSDRTEDHQTEWLELHDPGFGASCYYALQSGELRWELPDAAVNHVRQCDGEAVVRAVVAVQSTARAHQARTRVFAMKQRRREEFETEKQWPEWVLPGEDEVVGFPEPTSPRAQEAEVEPEAMWVEVYDPVQHVLYYYCSQTGATRWDAPDVFVSAAEDREVAAAITIQSLSRTRLARRQLHALKEEQEPRETTSQADAKEAGDPECEAIRRREMVQQELLQLAHGDRFWGLDVHAHEVERQQLEEELMARAEVLYRSANPRPGELVMSSSSGHVFHTYEEGIVEEDEDDEDEDSPKRRLRELQDESDARVAMAREETQQCADGDCFWGIQAEEIRQNEARVAMAEEEAESRQFGEDLHNQALCVAWAAEAEENAEEELAARGGQEQLMQTRYLRWFYQQCISVDELLGYNWPTKQQQQQQRLEEPPTPVTRRREPVAPQPPPLLGQGTPYLLDDLVVRKRLEHGDLRYGLRSLMTVHHQHMNGTRSSRFEIAQATSDCAFNGAAAAALLRRRERCSPFDPRRQSYHGMPVTPDMHYAQNGGGSEGDEGSNAALGCVNYRRSMTPDPNVPARFNGIPYRPSQISPTRDILCGDHRKLTQLPSLTKAKFDKGGQRQRLQKLQRAKPNARAKAKLRAKPKGRNCMEAHQGPNNNWDASTSACEREESDSALVSHHECDRDANKEDEGGVEVDPREQFAREEHRVLARVFALMDLDESGTVNQREMRWALQRDEEIHSLATTSPLLRLLLKRRTYMEYLFAPRDEADGTITSDADAGPASDGSELSWEVFLERCEHIYLRLMAEGLILPILIVPVAIDNGGLSEEDAQDAVQPHGENDADPGQEEDGETHEEHTIRRVFALLDSDGNGVLELAEVRQALYDTTNSGSNAIALANVDAVVKELRALVADSKALQPMLHEQLFMTAFSKFEPLDPRGICEEEFVAFCLEIAQVAAANNMAVAAE